MSAAELLPWKVSLKHLEHLKNSRQLTADPSDELVAEAAQQLLSISSKCSKQHNSEAPMPLPTCRKLVVELKWPLHACTAIAKAAQQQPKSPTVYAAVSLLQVFFSTAGTHFLDGSDHPPVASLQASVRQQVEQSGLLQQLPALMIAAAVELSAQAKDSSFLRYSQLSTEGLSVPFYSSGIRHQSIQLFKIVCHTGALYPADDVARLKALAGTGAAAMQLSLAATRHISAEVQEHMRNPGASCSNPYEMQGLMRQAYWTMGVVANIMIHLGSGSCSQYAAQFPQVARLLMASQLVPCLTLQATIAALAVHMIGPDIPATPRGRQERGAGSSGHQPQHHSSSSGGAGRWSGGSSNSSGSSNSGGRSNAMPAAQQQQQGPEVMPPGAIPSGSCPCCVESCVQHWQLACEWHSSLTPCHHKLFELLGVDARAVLWAAAANRDNCPAAATTATFLIPYQEHIIFMRKTPQQQSGTPTPRQQLERQLHLLLAAVLMHHVAALPVEHEGFVDVCLATAQAGYAAAAAWDHLRPLPAASSASLIGQGDGEWMHYPPDIELQQLLQLCCTLSKSLQQRLPAAAAGSTAGNAAAAAAAAAARQRQVDTADWGLIQWGLTQLASCMCKLVRPAVWVDTVLGRALGLSAVLAAMEEAEEAGWGHLAMMPKLQHGLFAVASLRDQAAEVMAALERCVRSTATALEAGQPPPSNGAGAFVYDLMTVITSLPSVTESEFMQNAVEQPSVGALVALAVAAGPGSAAQRQLHGLLTSALKLVYGPFATSGTPCLQLFQEGYVRAVAGCAVRLLAVGAATAASASAAAANSHGSSSSLAPGVVYLGIQDPSESTPCDPLDQLPWAVLYGRCCLLWAQQLQQELPRLLEAQQQGGQQQTWQQLTEGPAQVANFPTASWCLLAVPDDDCAQLELYTREPMMWLQDARVAGRLSAAGYQPQQVLEPLTQLMAVTQAAAEDSDPIALRALVQTLRAAGQALGTLATPVCCNNPSCSSSVGFTERQSVSGKGCICSGCRTARYCDRACQRAHWKQHKPVCKGLAAAAAATPGGKGEGQQALQQ